MVREKVGGPKARKRQTKPELGLTVIRRAKDRQLPFEAVACDDLYGRDNHFQTELDRDGILYCADVPANIQLYLQ
jgi:SRSO17 transposase